MNAIFLDKDGTLIVDKDYSYKIEDIEFIPRAFQALKLLQEKNYNLFIITNQSGIAKGYFTKKDTEKQLDFIVKSLNKKGIKIQKYSYCPHSPEENCECRKPKTKMLDDLIKKYKINTKKSFVIGDKLTDIETGKKLDIKTVLVMTGKTKKPINQKISPNFIAKDLYEASKIIANLKN